MCSFCNLLLSFCCNYFICESRILSSLNLLLYLGRFCKNLFSLLLLFLFLFPDPKNGGMAEDRGAPKAGQFPGPGPEVLQRQRVAKERAAQRFRNWTMQNEMRSVLGRVSEGTTGRIFDSAYLGEIRAYQ